MLDIAKLYVRTHDSLRAVMQCISQAALNGLPGGIALVVSEDGILKGVVTDGDLRRGLLAGVSLEDPVERIMIRDPIVFNSGMSYREILEEIPRRISEKGRYRRGIMEKVIILDGQGRVDKVLDFFELWRNQNMRHRHVSVVGMGYVGLTMAATLADAGFRVTGVENDSQIMESLNVGRPHFHEVGLEPMLKHHLGRSLKIESQLPRDAEVYVISVATPLGKDRQPDLSDVRQAASDVGAALSYGDLVVVRSTVPVGTCRQEVLPILERTSGLKCGRDFYLSFAPERTVEGKALAELRSLPQIVGGFDQNSTDLTANLFREITPSIIAVDSLEAAEMVKLVNNSFRDITFAYANELTLICEHYNLNARRIINAANDGYPRDRIPVPSPGVGGACLKKDPHLFIHVARSAGLSPCLSQLGREINEMMPGLVVHKVIKELERLGKSPQTSRFFLIGFAFKGEPETSDLRDSTTLDVLNLLRPVAGEIRGYDPVVPPSEIEKLGVTGCNLEEGFGGADCAIILNNHRSYAQIDIYTYLARMNRPAIYCDCWQIFSPEDVKQIEGITYIGLGFTA